MPYYNFKNRANKTSDRLKTWNKLDIIFSEYIRVRDADNNGICRCITCGDPHHWTDIDCGHYVVRGNASTRWDVRNANAQCRLCNSTNDGKAEEHGKAIDKKYGVDTAFRLEKLGREEKHFSEYELQGMIDELRKEIKALKEEKFK